MKFATSVFVTGLRKSMVFLKRCLEVRLCPFYYIEIWGWADPAQTGIKVIILYHTFHISTKPEFDQYVVQISGKFLFESIYMGSVSFEAKLFVVLEANRLPLKLGIWTFMILFIFSNKSPFEVVHFVQMFSFNLLIFILSSICLIQDIVELWTFCYTI